MCRRWMVQELWWNSFFSDALGTPRLGVCTATLFDVWLAPGRAEVGTYT